MKTQDNLANAFAGESQANRRYLAFAKKAESDGFPQVAKLFRAAAAAETVHALAHFRAMGGIKSTQDNLQAAVEGEGFEVKEMYPPYLKTAQEENNTQAAISFRNALAVEKIHYDLYSQAAESVDKGQDLPDQKVYVCAVCGNTVYGEAPDTCSVCGAPGSQFTEIQ